VNPGKQKDEPKEKRENLKKGRVVFGEKLRGGGKRS